MVATRLSEPRTPPPAVVRDGLPFRDEVALIAQEPCMQWLAIGIDIDARPAVAGMIGRRSFIYDLSSGGQRDSPAPTTYARETPPRRHGGRGGDGRGAWARAAVSRESHQQPRLRFPRGRR